MAIREQQRRCPVELTEKSVPRRTPFVLFFCRRSTRINRHAGGAAALWVERLVVDGPILSDVVVTGELPEECRLLISSRGLFSNPITYLRSTRRGGSGGRDSCTPPRSPRA